MIPWQTVAQTIAPDGETLVLVRRGDEWVVRAGRAQHVLMSSRQHGSEEALATVPFALCPHARDVLVGGLGLGFTARAVLSRLPAEGRMEIAEYVPDLVSWNREHVGALAAHPLDDARTSVFVGDVRGRLAMASRAFDLVLLDVDNGPTVVAHDANASLYDDAGTRLCFEALRPGGVLAVWSSGPHPPYLKTLQRAGFVAKAEPVAVRGKSRGGTHVLFLGRKRS
jgi:spermidine synthase